MLVSHMLRDVDVVLEKAGVCNLGDEAVSEVRKLVELVCMDPPPDMEAYSTKSPIAPDFWTRMWYDRPALRRQLFPQEYDPTNRGR